MAEGLHIALAQEPLTHVMGLPVTPTVITSVLVTVILLTFAFFTGRSLKVVPGKFQVAVEETVGGVYNYTKEALEDARLAERFFPLIMTIFLFILLSNFLGFLPVMETIGIETHPEDGHGEGHFVPFFYPVNADLNIPLTLAIISFLTVEISGIAYLGFLKYGSKFVNLKSPIDFAIGILEIIGNFARLISLSFRLFGNILAGHLLIMVIMLFVPLLLPLPFLFFEVFVAVMQAAIFALLTLFFLKLSIAEPHGQEAH